MASLDIARLRLHNVRLTGSPFKRPEDVEQWLGAVQAQDYAGAKWAIGQRVRDCVNADVQDAYASGKILRTHVMRPTWHFVMPNDIRWMLEFTAPRVRERCPLRPEARVDSEVYKRTNSVIVKALQGERI
jgi:hypothetical protein